MIKVLIETKRFILQLDTYDIGFGIVIQRKHIYGTLGIRLRLLMFDMLLIFG